MEVLDPLDRIDESAMFDGDVSVVLGSNNDRPKGASYAEMDQELQEEWNALVGGDPETNDDAAAEMEDAAVQMKNGKLVKRDSIQGVRVGSAGGWTLEVYPGDFVVHR